MRHKFLLFFKVGHDFEITTEFIPCTVKNLHFTVTISLATFIFLDYFDFLCLCGCACLFVCLFASLLTCRGLWRIQNCPGSALRTVCCSWSSTAGSCEPPSWPLRPASGWPSGRRRTGPTNPLTPGRTHTNRRRSNTPKLQHSDNLQPKMWTISQPTLWEKRRGNTITVTETSHFFSFLQCFTYFFKKKVKMK